MSPIIISLPLTAASANGLYTFSEGTGAASVRQAPAALLPRTPRNAEVVAVVPAAAVSWHAVELPAGKALRGANLRAVLVGLLEERVLDDAQQLHFALQPQWQAGQRAWVAVCQKAWLKGHLQALEAADVAVHRVVPELSPIPPQAPEAAPQLLVTGTPESSWLWVSATQGVWGLPFPSGRESLSAELLASAQLRAEPAVAEWAEHQLQRPPSLVQPAQRLLTAAQSDWDLAQFDLAATGSARWLKTLVRMQQTLWQSSAWRPARWGVGVLLLSQLLGLNAWAWKLQADLRQRQAGMAQVMSLTFPEIQVVVDAPLQMRREVQRLRQASGQTASDSLESLLAALGQTLPPGTALNQISYEAGELRAKDLALTEAQSAQLQTQLQTQQVQARRVGTEWVFSPWTSSPPRSAP